MTAVRDDTATTCAVCGRSYTRRGRQQWCSTECRQTAWRRRRAIPTTPQVPAKATTVYECDDCDTRYLGEQRCEDCNTWCRRISAGGLCPHCDEPVAITDIHPDDIAPR